MRAFLLIAVIMSVSVFVDAQNFWAGGVAMRPESSPKPTGWAAVAVLAESKTQIWSFSEIDFVPIGTHPVRIQTSVRTGLATPLRVFGSVRLFGLADAGAATSGITSGSAYSGGGIAVIPMKKAPWSAIVGVRVLKTSAGGTQTLVELGFGKTRQ